jgi:drug/metabolite transporter (DMT)-like permease
MVLAAALLWSSNAPFVRWITLDAVTVAGIRSAIAAVVLLPFLKPKQLKLNRYFFGFLACFLAITFGIILALKTTSAAIAVGMQYASCLWLFLLAKPKKQDLHPRRTWPMLLLLAGVALSMCSQAAGVTLLGNLIAVSTSFSFAGMTWFAKKMDSENPVGLAAIANLVMGIVALAISRPAPATLMSLGTAQWLVILYLGVFQIGVSYSLYYAGLRHTTAATASMLCPLEMILGPVWTALFLQEYPDAVGLVGFLAVTVGVLGEAILSGKKK